MTDQPATLRADVLAHTTRLLAGSSPMTARDIAAALTKAGLVGVDKKLVNSVLTIEGKDRFSYDRATYTYALSNPDALAAPAPTTHTDRGPEINRDVLLAACRKLIVDGKPRTAKEIAAELTKQGMAGVDKSLVGSVLMREGKELFTYDRTNYTYSPR